MALKKCKDTLTPQQLAIIQKIGESADKVHEQCYLVGGLVRDCLMGQFGDDLDFVCSNPNKIVSQLQSEDSTIKEIEKNDNTRFKSKIIMMNGQKIDIVEPRKESYTKQSIKPKVESGSFYDDVNRRDFTINTLYLDTSPSHFLQIVDLTERGLVDLQQKIIDTPTDPNTTFQDDPSRMLRGVRFASCKNMELHPRIIESIQKGMKKEIRRVPNDLITKELKKGSTCPSYFSTLNDMSLLSEIIPEITALKGLSQPKEHHTLDVLGHTIKSLDHLKTKDYRVAMAMLLHDIGKPETTQCVNDKCIAHGHQEVSATKSKAILERMRFSQKDVKYITNLIQNHHILHNALDDPKISDKAIRRLVREHGEYLPEIEIMTRADITSDNPHAKREIAKLDTFMTRVHNVQTQSPELQTFILAITGHDLMDYGYKGKEIGDMKKYLEQEVIDGRIENKKDVLLQRLKKK